MKITESRYWFMKVVELTKQTETLNGQLSEYQEANLNQPLMT